MEQLEVNEGVAPSYQCVMSITESRPRTYDSGGTNPVSM